MNDKFYIVDDDKVIQRMLKKIILDHKLGDIIGISGDGLVATREIRKLQPDIVLVDLLLPYIDGIGIVSELKRTGCKSTFIMISEVTSKDMVSKAYKMGIEFYINKPINVIEVISVINNVKEKMNMSMVIQSVERAMKKIDLFKANSKGIKSYRVEYKNQIKSILAQLGIMGEAGTNDIIEIIALLLERDIDNSNSLKVYTLTNLYNLLNEKYEREYGLSSNIAAIEQRIRRAVYKALQNIASLGIEDYSNEIFRKYSSSLFHFEEVRKQMDFIKGKSKYSGKVNIKKFIEGLVVLIKNDIL